MQKRDFVVSAAVIVLIMLASVFVVSDNKKDHSQRNDVADIAPESTDVAVQKHPLQIAYPNFIDTVSNGFVIWKDGTQMPYTDSVSHSNYEDLLNHADLEEQMQQRYVSGAQYEIPHKNFDPGRVRNEAFFRKMYGHSKAEVEGKLVSVSWLPQWTDTKLRVTAINGVDQKVKAVSDELQQMPHLKKYLTEPGGTYYWRKIAGTDRLSMHSFGIAIDINVAHSDYWRWSPHAQADSIPYTNRIPVIIAEVFEKHGFIWGGKWYHYDTMHFEYRPELLVGQN